MKIIDTFFCQALFRHCGSRLICLLIMVLCILPASAQYERYLNKSYAETLDSLSECIKRFDDEAAEWEKIKDFAVVRHDKRLELACDLYLAHDKRYKYILPDTQLISVYQDIIDRAEKLKFLEMKITCLGTQAELYLEMGNYEAGFAVCTKVLKQLEDIPDKIYPDKIQVYNSIVRIYFNFHEYEMTVNILKKAIATPVTERNFRRHLSARNTLGMCYDNLNKPDSAYFYFQRTLLQRNGFEYQSIIDFNLMSLF
jgi:tetratricopeptide (TPR) repeat protein